MSLLLIHKLYYIKEMDEWDGKKKSVSEWAGFNYNCRLLNDRPGMRFWLGFKLGHYYHFWLLYYWSKVGMLWLLMFLCDLTFENYCRLLARCLTWERLQFAGNNSSVDPREWGIAALAWIAIIVCTHQVGKSWIDLHWRFATPRLTLFTH